MLNLHRRFTLRSALLLHEHRSHFQLNLELGYAVYKMPMTLSEIDPPIKLSPFASSQGKLPED